MRPGRPYPAEQDSPLPNKEPARQAKSPTKEESVSERIKFCEQ
jgi:hypothetical protein